MVREHIANRPNTIGRTLAAGLLAVGLGGAPSALAQDAADQDIEPAQIADAVDDELLLDPGIIADTLDVSVSGHTVTLDGRVATLADKHRAQAVASTVRGVKRVKNNLDVDPVDRGDAQIRSDVITALAIDPATDSFEIDLSVDDGAVTLRGEVASWTERSLAGKVARSIRGVRQIDNRLQVDADPTRSDTEIREEIKSALYWDALVDAGRVDVRVQDGKATLSGWVGSAAELTRAIEAAWVSGVTSVDSSGLEVGYWDRTGELVDREAGFPTDTGIADAVETALAGSLLVNEDEVAVDVHRGRVTLRGEVQTLAAKREAAAEARQTTGVWRVKNHLKVRPDGDALDAEIRANINDALARNAVTESYEVGVEVESGVVTLDGVVDTYYEKAEAERVAARIAGVIKVNNTIEVISLNDPLVYDPYVYDYAYYDYAWYPSTTLLTVKTDREIREDIQSQLWWSPFVDSDEVTVTVDDGVATLTGAVESWSEYRSATENAWDGGAIAVDNEIDVNLDE